MIEKYKFLDYPIFITGNATSGTTLLRNLLDGHKDLMVFPVQMGLRAFLDKEGKLYSDFEIDSFFQSGPTTGLNSLSLNKASNDSGDRDYTDINFNKLKKRVCSEWDQKTAKDLQNKVIKSFFDCSKYNKVSPKMWIEKTHGNDKYIELFLSWYPAAKIIHIIRDPYDNFSSYRKKMAKNGEAVDAVSFCVEWTLSIDRVLKAYKKYPKQVHILQFEKLLQSPSSELLKICSFLNISYDTIIQAPTTYGVDWTGNSQLDKKFKKISKKPIGSHNQNIMSSHDIDIIATMVKRYSSFLYWEYPVRSALLLKKLSLKQLMITFSIKFNFFMQLRAIHRVLKLIKLN